MITATVNLSTARKNISAILNGVFLRDETYVITKGSIPVAKIMRVDSSIKTRKGARKLDLSLFGYLAKDKRSTLAIENELRMKAWSR